MKNLLYSIAVILAFLAACTSEPYSKPKPFLVEGTVESWDSGWVYLQFREEGRFVNIDSSYSADGKFVFKGDATFPKVAYVKLEGVNRPVTFFLEAGKINISAVPDNINGAVITGSPTQDIYQKYLDENKVYGEQMQEIYKFYSEAQQMGNQGKMDSLMQDYELVQKQELEHLLSFMGANTKSVVTPYLALRNLYRLELEEVEKLDSNLDPSLAGSQYVSDLKDRIAVLQSVQIGKVAPEFSMNDINGNPLNLSSLRGHYVLVDFWASWCGPCRVENPNIVAAYNKYCNLGFDILGVSLDTDRDKWLKAIEDDHLTWHHVSDLKGWANDAAKLYGVNSIPSSVLLDPEGVIIARNLRENALHEKLEQIFSGKLADK